MAMIATETFTKQGSHVTALFDAFFSFFGVRGERATLKSLDTDRLTDLGLTRKQAFAEARRPVWDVPGYWKR